VGSGIKFGRWACKLRRKVLTGKPSANEIAALDHWLSLLNAAATYTSQVSTNEQLAERSTLCGQAEVSAAELNMQSASARLLSDMPELATQSDMSDIEFRHAVQQVCITCGFQRT
jgi:hypothetical protein